MWTAEESLKVSLHAPFSPQNQEKASKPRSPFTKKNNLLISIFQVRTEAATLVPGLKTFAIPKGLQVEKGPDAIVEFLVENLPGLLEPETKV